MGGAGDSFSDLNVLIGHFIGYFKNKGGSVQVLFRQKRDVSGEIFCLLDGLVHQPVSHADDGTGFFIDLSTEKDGVVSFLNSTVISSLLARWALEGLQTRVYMLTY